MNFQSEKSDFTAISNKKQVIFGIEKNIESKKHLILSQDFKGKNLMNNYFIINNKNNSNEKINESNNSEKRANDYVTTNKANKEINRILFKTSSNPQNNFNQSLTPDSFMRKLTKKSLWTAEEDIKLSNLIDLHGKKSWRLISSNFKNKSRKQCFLRWRMHLAKNSYLKNKTFTSYRIKSESSGPLNNSNKTQNQQESQSSTLLKKSWTENEDEIMIRWVNIMGNKNWTKCSKLLFDKTPKDCKSRWFEKLVFEESNATNCSSPDYWNRKDEILLMLFIRKFGTCWSKISKLFENKSGNQIKNKFNCLARLAFKNEDLKNNKGGFEMEQEANENFDCQNLYNNYKNKNSTSVGNNQNNDDEEEENSTIIIKEKAEKIISYLVNSNNEYVYNQNVLLFREAKKCFNDKVSSIYSSSATLSSCINNLQSKGGNGSSEAIIRNIAKGICENNITKVFQAEEEAKKFNICCGCLLKLRNHIKRKIILKLKNSNFNSKTENLKNYHNPSVSISNHNNNNCFADEENKEFNFSFNGDIDKSEILNKLPQLIEMINTLKEKIAI